MAFSRTAPLLIAIGLLILASIDAMALPSLGNCRIETNEISGLTRTICNTGELTSYSTFKKSGTSYQPEHLVRTVKPINTYYTQRINTPSTMKVGADAALKKRLCPDGKTPILATDPNPDGSVSRIVKCLSGTIAVGQESASFLQSSTRLARWASLRDPYLYTQKTNRPFTKNY